MQYSNYALKDVIMRWISTESTMFSYFHIQKYNQQHNKLSISLLLHIKMARQNEK